MKIGLREIIFFKLMLGLLLAAYFFGFRRMEAKTAAYEQQTVTKQQRLADLARASRDIDDIADRVKKLEQAIQLFEKKLPEEQALDTILLNVTQLMEDHKLTGRSFKPNPKTIAGPNYREKQIEVTLSGHFYGFYAFLADLERLERIIKITDMKLTKIDDVDGQMRAVMKLSIFFDPATPTVASAN